MNTLRCVTQLHNILCLYRELPESRFGVLLGLLPADRRGCNRATSSLCTVSRLDRVQLVGSLCLCSCYGPWLIGLCLSAAGSWCAVEHHVRRQDGEELLGAHQRPCSLQPGDDMPWWWFGAALASWGLGIYAPCCPCTYEVLMGAVLLEAGRSDKETTSCALICLRSACAASTALPRWNHSGQCTGIYGDAWLLSDALNCVCVLQPSRRWTSSWEESVLLSPRQQLPLLSV